MSPRLESNANSVAADDHVLEQLVDRFEDAWEKGLNPLLKDYLPPEEMKGTVIACLAHIDLERRLKAGEVIRVEFYLQQFPVLAADATEAVALIGQEFELRRRSEATVSGSEYLSRFPQFEQQLRDRLPAASLVGPPVVGDSAAPTSSADGFDAYELLGELGRGGMGVVYKARQKKLNRIVAMKMLLSGNYASSEELVRFLVEAEAVARMQHPNIVQIFETGQHQGLPYFTLEFVEGGSLTTKLDGTPIPPQDAAKLVETLARGVYYAHKQGIVHRDLKPGNVLLAKDGTPKITDFGLAKKVEGASGLTQSGAIVGTPSYMAPEQADGRSKEIGPAADVYALGAILYECLTGRPPFKAVTPVDTILQVLYDEPVSLRRLQRTVSRDLETICLKCLQKEAAKRYRSAEELAEDLRRFQAGEPILARPIGKVARSWRWCRRNPLNAGLMATTAVVVLVALVSLSVAVSLLLSEQKQTKEALRRADARNKFARGAANDLAQVAEKWLVDAPFMTDEQRQVLLKVIGLYEELAQEKLLGPQERKEAGIAYRRMGDFSMTLRDFQHAEQAYVHAIEIFESLTAEFPDVLDYRQELCSNHRKLAWILPNLERHPDAEKHLRLALHLAATFPQEPALQHDCACVNEDLAYFLQYQGKDKYRDSEGYYKEALRIQKTLVTADHKEASYAASQARTMIKFACLLDDMGRSSDAEMQFREAAELLEALLKTPPQTMSNRSELGGCCNMWGHVLATLDRPAEAEAVIKRSIAVRQQLNNEFPKLTFLVQGLAVSHNNMGRLLVSLDRPKEAEPHFQDALDLQQKLLKSQPDDIRVKQDFTVMLANRAWLYLDGPLDLQQPKKAKELIEKAQEMVPAYGQYLTALLGVAHYRLGHFDEATKLLSRAVREAEESTQLLRWWKSEMSMLRQVAERRERQVPAISNYFLAMSYHRLGDAKTAMQYFERAQQAYSALKDTTSSEKMALMSLNMEAAALLSPERR